ncbi:SPOSA6832_01999 [Sporobolomyces salmonicolor]|uniref:SPOSA6832_01999-mRNA-1:cds n=1 Tax=Sporidiobolus salmonicolor TaxID=5005 RepID=A0A0D6EKG1_SPOSA|nr:SPOSA6832_01999 [Sporobolomyces salmonicolor]
MVRTADKRRGKLAHANSLLHDSILLLVLLAAFAAPVVLFWPSSFFQPLLDVFDSVLSALFWLTVTVLAVLVVGALALVGEKAYRRVYLGERPDDASRVSTASPTDPADAQRRAKRFTREARMDAAAEKLVDKLEASRVGKLFRRKGRKARDQAKANEDEVELDDLRGQGTSTGVTRIPPPLPPR